MKVLLYEPGITGHRAVILDYITELLRIHKIDFHVEKSSLAPNEVRAKLLAIAIDNSCNVIHILTFDGLGPKFILSAIRQSLSFTKIKVPFVVTYYLFDNVFSGLTASLYKFALRFAGVRLIFVPDERLLGRKKKIDPSVLCYLPDPVDMQQFVLSAQATARTHLGIQSPNGLLIFLLFGEISSRKGLGIMLRAFEILNEPSKAVLYIVGRINPKDCNSDDLMLLEYLVSKGLVKVCDGWICESDVSVWYCSADYFISCYPKSFTVSSGTFTRACCAGVPTLAGNHGQVSRAILANNCGLLYDSQVAESLVAALRRAISIAGSTEYFEMANRAKEYSVKHSLTSYFQKLSDGYLAALGPMRKRPNASTNFAEF